MSAPLTPAPLPELAYSRFRFVPAIAGAEHNEWTLRRATWTEMVVVNVLTGQELAIPRRFLGRVFETENSVRDVRLIEDLECAGGRARPVRRGVIEMRPRVEADIPPWLRSRPVERASVVTIRTEAPNGSRMRRALRGSIAVGFVACLAMVVVVRDADLGTPSLWTNRPVNLGLLASDDYASVIGKLGVPANDQWLKAPNGRGYRRLLYPSRRIAVILTGETNETARYAGALSRNGRVLHAPVPDAMNDLLPMPAWR